MNILDNHPEHIDPRVIVGLDVVDEIDTLTIELRTILARAKVLGPRIANALAVVSERTDNAARSLPEGTHTPTGGCYQDRWFEDLTLKLNYLTAYISEVFEYAVDHDAEALDEVLERIEATE